FGLVTVIFGAVMAAAGKHAGSMTTFYALTGLIYLIYFLVFVFIASRVINLTYNSAMLEGVRLRSSVRARDLARLSLLDTLAILPSRGMLIPWAMIGMARYRASRLVLVAEGDLDALKSESEGQVSAVGAEMDHVFDLDIGL